MNPGSSIPVLGGTGYLGSRVGSRVLRLWRARHPTKLDYGPLCFWVVGWYIFVSVVGGGLFLVFLGVVVCVAGVISRVGVREY